MIIDLGYPENIGPAFRYRLRDGQLEWLTPYAGWVPTADALAQWVVDSLPAIVKAKGE